MLILLTVLKEDIEMPDSDQVASPPQSRVNIKSAEGMENAIRELNCYSSAKLLDSS